MPEFTATHPRGEYVAAGVTVQLPHIFSGGSTIDENIAKYLNGALATTVANGHAGAIRRALVAEDKKRAEAHKAKTYKGPMTADGKRPAPTTAADLGWDHQAKALEAFTKYKPGVSNRGGGGPRKDPLVAIARAIATRFVKGRIVATGRSVKAYIDKPNAEHGNELKRMAAEAVANLPWIMEQARAELAAKENAEKSNPDAGLDFGSIPVQKAA